MHICLGVHNTVIAHKIILLQSATRLWDSAAWCPHSHGLCVRLGVASLVSQVVTTLKRSILCAVNRRLRFRNVRDAPWHKHAGLPPSSLLSGITYYYGILTQRSNSVTSQHRVKNKKSFYKTIWRSKLSKHQHFWYLLLLEIKNRKLNFIRRQKHKRQENTNKVIQW
jgi:hypothetical protein